MIEELDVAVVGGGVSGLASAYFVCVRRPDLRVGVLESSERIGGNIRTERIQGHLLDAGPDSFLRTKPHAVDLCRELGLGEDLRTTRPEARSAFVAHRGTLERLPAGLVLAVPTRLGPMLSTPLLSFFGKLRVLCEVLLPRRRTSNDESIQEFLTRRFGIQAASRLGAPLLGGIYAGDAANLSLRATFPQLAELEDRWGSVIYGLFRAQLSRTQKEQGARAGRLRRTRDFWSWMHRAPEDAPSPFMTLRGGLGSLVDGLSIRLPTGAVRTSTSVRAIEREGERFLIRTERGTIKSRAAILCSPGHATARMLPEGRLRTELEQIPYASTATIFFAFPRNAVAHRLDGVGFIASERESELLAGTWVSSKWEERAPEGSILLRAFVGGARSPGILDRSDAELEELARSELERLMGPLGVPLFTRVYRYERASPQPTIGHPARLDRIRAELATLPGLSLAGAAYDGVGIPDCIRQGRSAVDALLERL